MKDALELAAELLHPARVLTAGQAALLVARQHVSGCDIAARCGVSEVSVSRWTRGRLVPSPMARAILLDAYGIAIELWTRPVARPRAECLRKKGSKDA
jgi:transcriptional regulator with XRE-family HTH domain